MVRVIEKMEMMIEDYDRDRQLCFEDGNIYVLYVFDYIFVIFVVCVKCYGNFVRNRYSFRYFLLIGFFGCNIII